MMENSGLICMVGDVTDSMEPAQTSNVFVCFHFIIFKGLNPYIVNDSSEKSMIDVAKIIVLL